LHVYDVAVLPV